MTEPVLHIDFETRSVLDLKAAGLHRYARHSSTDVWCMAGAIGDEEPRIVTAVNGAFILPPSFHQHVTGGGVVVAHNAPFELAIWNEIMVPRHHWPVLLPEQTHCTMAMAYAMNLPGALEDAALALGLDVRKDAEGRALMLRMARPRSMGSAGPIWWDEVEKVLRLCAYCKQDVRVERALHHRLMPLSDYERRVWLMDYRINQRGVRVDTASAKAAVEMSGLVKEAADEKIADITQDKVTKHTALIPLKTWLAEQGVVTDGLDKQTVVDLLAAADLPDNVRRVLEIRQEVGKASVAKLDTMLEIVSVGDRVYDLFQYWGAATGRWAGRKLQPHNFIRDVPDADDVETALKLVREKNYRMLQAMYGPPLSYLSRCMRGFFLAKPGHVFTVGDFSAVEGRGTAWVSGEEWKLQLFRDCDANPDGPDVYMHTAGGILHIKPDDVNKSQRQAYGKVPELALGYQGGVGAFQTMAKTYGVKVSDAEADSIKVEWRQLHPATVRTWYALQRAAIAAVENPGDVFRAGHPDRGVAFRKVGSFLWCLLPSGRCLCYPYPKVLEGKFGPQLTYMTVPSAEDRKKGKVIEDPANGPKWARVGTYGGSLMENVVQAICRDLLVDCMLRLEAEGYHVVLHVHDEIVIEVPEACAAAAKRDMHRIMNTPPSWARDFPMNTKPETMRRYGK